MAARPGEDIDDYCTRCHRLTTHAVDALVEDRVVSVTCRTCGFQHTYKGGRVPPRPKSKVSPFDQVLAGILGEHGSEPEKPAAPKREAKAKAAAGKPKKS